MPRARRRAGIFASTSSIHFFFHVRFFSVHNALFPLPLPRWPGKEQSTRHPTGACPTPTAPQLHLRRRRHTLRMAPAGREDLRHRAARSRERDPPMSALHAMPKISPPVPPTRRVRDETRQGPFTSASNRASCSLETTDATVTFFKKCSGNLAPGSEGIRHCSEEGGDIMRRHIACVRTPALSP